MKSLFALGAWSLAALAFTGAAFGQYPRSTASGTPYWVTSEGAVGSGVAPVAQPAQHAYTPSHSTPGFNPVNYQRDAPGVGPRVAPPNPAPAPAFSVGPAQGGPAQIGPGQFGPAQVGPAQIGVSPAQNNFTLDTGSFTHQGHSKHSSSGWFGGAGGLFLDRDNSNTVWLSVDDVNITDKVLTTRDAEMDIAGGFQLSLGRYFADNCRAWQLTYWGVFPSEENAYAYNGVDTVGQLGSSRTFDGLDYNGATVASAYNLADAHWLRRDYQFHNVEWNILGSMCATGCGGKGQALFGQCGKNCGSCSKGNSGCGSCGGGGCSSCYGAPQSNWRWNWLAGFRYFRFDEGMTYATDAGDTVFDGAVDEVYYDIDVENHLFGFQIGGVADYCMSSRWNWRNAVKVGLYGSHVNHYSHIGGSAGTATVNNINSPYNGDDFLINSSKEDFSAMGEWDTALTYQCSCNWRARVGYRVVGISGVAFAANQIPTATFVDLHQVRLVDTNGSLILHGGYASLEYNY